MNDKHVGSFFDDFLNEDSIKDEVEAKAKNNILRASINAFADKLYTHMKEFNKDDDYEFGAWDHFMLSTLIVTWLKMHRDQNDTGINSVFFAGDMESDEAIEAAKNKRTEVLNYLIDGFSKLAKGDDSMADAYGPEYDKLMDTFAKYYGAFWW